MRQVRNLEDLTNIVRELQDKFDKLFSYSLDMHGRRITNVGEAKDINDCITKHQFDELEKRIKALENK